MEAHRVRECRPRKVRYFQVVMQEFHQLPGRGPDLPDLWRVVKGVKVEPNMMDATPRRSDDRIKVLEAVDKVSFGSGSIFLTTAVGHRLSAAGLIKRILKPAAKSFQKLQGCDADFGAKSVNVTRNEEPDPRWDRSSDAGS